jgi:hypothetical protein
MIRVGDVVTLGRKTGVVSRIRMRATTIVDPILEYVVQQGSGDRAIAQLDTTDYTNRVIVVNVATGRHRAQCPFRRPPAAARVAPSPSLRSG